MLLYQPQEGYCYNSDSIFLYDFISSFNPRGRMLDVGAGCGVVGLNWVGSTIPLTTYPPIIPSETGI